MRLLCFLPGYLPRPYLQLSFPLIKSLKLNPAVVDTMAPRELQLQSIGFLRQFSPFDQLNNLDPDFAALQQAFETGAARSTADAQDYDCVEHRHEEEDNGSLESSGEGLHERAVGTWCAGANFYSKAFLTGPSKQQTKGNLNL